jgi:hypothetical protein
MLFYVRERKRLLLSTNTQDVADQLLALRVLEKAGQLEHQDRASAGSDKNSISVAPDDWIQQSDDVQGDKLAQVIAQVFHHLIFQFGCHDETDEGSLERGT